MHERFTNIIGLPSPKVYAYDQDKILGDGDLD